MCEGASKQTPDSQIKPRQDQNVIDKVNMKIFFPVLAFKKRSEVCFVIFQVNKYV